VSYRFSKWDENDTEKYIGDKESWERTQDMMRDILSDLKVPFVEADGEAAFYGPKLDIQIRNVYGKEDTLITIQIDFQLAERFGMQYADSDGQKKYPVVIHRTSIGCYERTLALLIEKYAGALPTWIAPVQVKVLPITDRASEASLAAAKSLEQYGIRVETDLRNEKIGFKIREAQLQKTPYMLVLGDKEVEGSVVSVRSRKDGDLGVMKLEDFRAKLLEEIATRAKS
jgi:threonyl-tRNA synthetase